MTGLKTIVKQKGMETYIKACAMWPLVRYLCEAWHRRERGQGWYGGGGWKGECGGLNLSRFTPPVIKQIYYVVPQI